ncbi:MAG: PVC-type heme-binding CxxCH protein [Planctomycetaceae bacterium]
MSFTRVRAGWLWVLTLFLVFRACSAFGEEAKFSPPRLQVPDGFVVELAAAPPLVKYPMMGCLDERGRLFIAESHGQNLDKAGLLKAKHRFIRMLEDTDGDGRFDKSTIFADGLVMPEGALWYRGSLYVLSSPYLWRFQDTDGDGVADVREKLVGEMEFNGKANQHGAYLGPCGRLYFSGGAFGYDLVGSDGNPAYPVGQASAAGVFSCRPDGSDVQIFGTGGINPVEVVFSPEGELFTTCPIIDTVDGRHDALIHWIRGATVGPKDFRPPPLPQTGYRLPPLSRWGQVAPSGLMMYRGQALGEEYTDRLFATHFNTRTVVSTKIERHGATYRSFDADFLTSPNPDFHPTDIMEDADGSLLLIDTGGWFRISCPFSKTAKPEIPGAIYRIRRSAAKPVDDPRGLALNWNNPSLPDLWNRLDDPRPVVRDRALAAWHDMGNKGSDFLVKRFLADAAAARRTQPPVSRARRNAVWAASRIGSPRCRRLILAGLSDPDVTVRHAAARSAGILRDPAAVPKLQAMLLDAKSAWSLRRAAATALGQIGDAKSVSALLASAAQGGDDFFNHAVVYASIEIGDFDETAKSLALPNPQIQHAALVALDRIAPDKLTQSHVAPLLESDDDRLRQTALDLVSRRDGWSDQIIGFLETFASQDSTNPQQQASVRGAIVNFAQDKRVQHIVAQALTSPKTASKVRSVLLAGLARMPSFPTAWLKPLAHLLDDDKRPDLIQETVSVLIASGTDQLDDQVRAVATNTSHADQLRATAWICLCERGAAIPDAALSLLSQRATRHDVLGPLDRLESARAIASAQLTPNQLASVAARVSHAGPVELPTLLNAFAVDANKQLAPQTASTLLASLNKSPGLTNLSRAQLEAVLQSFPEAVRRQAAPLVDKLKANDAQQTDQLNTIAAQLVKGDVDRGRKIFSSNQLACSACHRIAGTGGTIGPDLSRIGGIRKRRDLLEAIVFPSATIVNNYETWSAVTSNGRIHSGVIQRATTRSIVLRNTQRMEIELDRNDIDELVRQPTSIMPRGLDRTLSTAELSDLLAFLQSLRGQQK